MAPAVVGIAASGRPGPGEAVSFHAFATDPGRRRAHLRLGLRRRLERPGRAASTPTRRSARTSPLTVGDGVTSTSATRTVQVVTAADDGAVANGGHEFWLAFNQNHLGGGALSLFITAPADTSGTVEIPGLGFATTFDVEAGAVTTVTLPPEASLPAAGRGRLVPHGGARGGRPRGGRVRPELHPVHDRRLPRSAARRPRHRSPRPVGARRGIDEIAVVATANATDRHGDPVDGPRPRRGRSAVHPELDLGEVLLLPGTSDRRHGHAHPIGPPGRRVQRHELRQRAGRRVRTATTSSSSSRRPRRGAAGSSPRRWPPARTATRSASSPTRTAPRCASTASWSPRSTPGRSTSGSSPTSSLIEATRAGAGRPVRQRFDVQRQPG